MTLDKMEDDSLYQKIISFDNLYKAYRRVRLGKRYYLAQQKYEFKLESNLVELGQELKDPGKYKPRPYHRFVVYEPKKRQVSAPHFNDRIVHQAVVFIIEPLIVKHFIENTYACIKGRGTHKAVADVRARLDLFTPPPARKFR